MEKDTEDQPYGTSITTGLHHYWFFHADTFFWGGQGCPHCLRKLKDILEKSKKRREIENIQ